MPQHQQLIHSRPYVAPGNGFTLVEVLVAMVVLTIGVTGLGTLWAIRSGNQVAINRADQRTDAVSADIAEVRRINDRYTCKGVSTATASCTVSNSDVDQGDYQPDPETPAETNFLNRCRYNPSTFNLVSDLATKIPNNPSLSAAGVTRTINTSAQGGAHLYTVTYTADGNTLASLNLVPTAAAWCP